MAAGFEGSAHIDRPVEEVFAFVADGENDPKFSPRVLEIAKTTDGPVGIGTVYESTVKDAGMKSQRKFEITEFEAPARIRWKETSDNMITVPNGGYDIAAEDGGTRLTVHNEFEGHGFGKVLLPIAARAARRDADAFAGRIKEAVEAS